MLEILNTWFHAIGRLVMPTLYDLNPKLKPQAKKATTAAVKKKPGRPKKAAAKK